MKKTPEEHGYGSRLRLFESILGSTNDAVVVTEAGLLDEPGPKIVYANEAFLRMTGYEVREVLGKSPRILQGPETGRAELGRIRVALEKGEPIRVELLNYRKDGERFWVDISFVPIRDERGGISNWAAIQRETTERREKEERLREMLLKYGSDMVTVLEPDGTPRYESESIERVLGYRHKEVVGDDFYRFVHPDDARKLAGAHEKAMKTPGLSLPVEFRILNAGGSWRYFESIANNMIDDPDVNGVVVNSRDITGRKQAEMRVQEAEARYRALVEEAPAIIYIQESRPGQNASYNVSYMSPRVEEILGYPAEKFVEEPDFWYGITHPDDLARLAAEDERTDETGEPFSMEYRMISRDGVPVWVRDEAVLSRGLEGEPLYWQGIMTDVTVRKQAEEDFRKSEERFRSVVHNSSEIVEIMAPDGTLKYASPAFERVLGYDPEASVGLNVLDYIHPDDLPRVREEIETAFKEPGITRNLTEYRVRHSDGSWRHLEASGVYLMDDPSIRGLLVTQRDVTDARRAEEILHQSEERFRGAFEGASNGVALVSLDGRFLKVNPSLCEMFGYSQEELLTKRTSDLTHPEGRETSRLRMERLLSGEGSGRDDLEKRYICKDGRVVWVISDVSLVRDSDGEPSHFVSQFQDITERKQTEEKLKESEERYRRQALELDLLHRVRTVVARGMNLETVFETIVDATAGVYGYKLVSAYLLRDGELVLQHQVGHARAIEFIPLDRGVNGRVARTGQPEFLEDVSTDPEFLGAFEGTISEICVPLLDGGEVVGTLNVESTNAKLTDHDLELVCALGEHVSTAVVRARLYDKARGAERRYRSLVEQIPAIIYIDDADESNSALYRSPYVEEILGYKPEEFLSDPYFWQDLLHPDDREWVLAENDRTNETGDPFRIEYRMICKDGHVVWVRDEAILLYDEEGRPLYWQGVFLDVTERKEAEEALRRSEESFRQLFENSVDALMVIDYDTRKVVDCNREACRSLGYTREEFLKLSLEDWVSDVIPDEERKRRGDDTPWARAMAGETGAIIGFHENLHTRKDGTTFPVEVGVGSIDYRGRRMILTSVRDITERKEAEDEVIESREKYRSVVESVKEVIFRTDARGRFTFLNPAWTIITGFEVQESLDKSYLDFIYHSDLERNIRDFETIGAHGEDYSKYEAKFATSDGGMKWIEVNFREHFDGGAFVGTSGTLDDITGRKELEERLEYQAYHDALTGLANRTMFNDRVNHALDRGLRRETLVAILFLDLDNFKIVNDSLGHEAGDRLLAEVAERLMGCMRPEDTVCRLGGDEFAILLEDSNSAEATLVARRIADALKKPFYFGGLRDIFVTTSVGIAVGKSSSGSPSQEVAKELIKKADMAMYRAKGSGKASHAVFESSLDERAATRLTLEGDLRRAIEQDEFQVCYQPMVSISTGEIVGAEALLRWRHPERGLLPPDAFIPLAEEGGLIVQVGKWVLREATRRAREWREGRDPLRPLPAIHVNLSSLQLQCPDLVRDLARILDEAALEPEALTLEITESVALEEAEPTIVRLKELGLKLAIDDFGTGYSSLSYLRGVPPDCLKIDRSFIDGLGRNRGDDTIVGGIIGLAHGLGIQAVAEGVETKEQLERLKTLGCDVVQGYMLWKPLSTAEALKLFTDRPSKA